MPLSHWICRKLLLTRTIVPWLSFFQDTRCPILRSFDLFGRITDPFSRRFQVLRFFPGHRALLRHINIPHEHEHSNPVGNSSLVFTHGPGTAGCRHAFSAERLVGRSFLQRECEDRARSIPEGRVVHRRTTSAQSSVSKRESFSQTCRLAWPFVRV